MSRKSANHLAMVVVLLSLPVVLQAQELSADVVTQRANGTVERGKLYKGRAAVRLELSAGTQAPNGVIIYDLNRQVGYSLTPAMKVYVERPGLAAGPVSMFVPQKGNPCALVPGVARDAACQKIGSETINGRRCEKWQATQTRGGRTIVGDAWVDSELQLAIKWQDSRGEIGQLENIHLGPQSASLFALPSGYRKVEMPSRTR
jgi:hypothetical protein